MLVVRERERGDDAADEEDEEAEEEEEEASLSMAPLIPNGGIAAWYSSPTRLDSAGYQGWVVRGRCERGVVVEWSWGHGRCGKVRW